MTITKIEADGTRVDSKWASVRMTPALTPKVYAALSRRIRRRGCEFVAVPTAAGRIFLTNAELDIGEVVSAADLESTIEALVSAMLDDGRISGTVGTRKAKKDKGIKWTRVGATKIDRAAAIRVHSLHGCPPIKRDPDVRRGRTDTTLEWDVSLLTPDGLLALWSALGVRVIRGRR